MQAFISERAYAKINLGLDVLRRRGDGYHELRMGMQTVSLADELTIERSGREDGGIKLLCDRPELPTDGRNLAYRAAEVFLRHLKITEGVSISLQKNIPAAAGLAGGSADAAAVLRGLNRLFEAGLSVEALRELALPLGADIPYCVTGGTMLAEGIGEQLTALPALPGCSIVLVKPEFDLSTASVYGNLHVEELPSEAHPDMDAVIAALRAGDLKRLGAVMRNILELPAGREHSEIQDIKATLTEAGACAVSMSGSGSAVFGIFEDGQMAERCPARLRARGFTAAEICLTTPIVACSGPGYGNSHRTGGKDAG